MSSKNLAFHGKGLNIVGGSKVSLKKDDNKRGEVVGITFNHGQECVPKKYQVKWEDGSTTWINAKLIKATGW